MKRLLPLFLVVALLLCACGAEPAPTTVATEAPTEAPTTAATEAPTTAPTTVPTEAPVIYRHPLTGEILDAPFTGRVYAVSQGNTEPALPQHGIGQADIIHEILVEGSATRFAALYTNPEKVPAIGSVRSARTYLLDIGTSYNAIYNHCGGSTLAGDFISENDTAEVDAMYHSEFYRDQDRLDAGYDLEHTLFIHGEDLPKLAAEVGYDTQMPADTDYGFRFTDTPVALKGEKADELTLYFTGDDSGKTTTLLYDAETGFYHANQWDQDLIDGADNSVVQFKNIFILQAETWVASNGVHKLVDMHGDGEGWFATNGQIIPIQWHRENLEDSFTYTLADGTPLEQNPGTSYIGFIPDYGTIEFE